MAARRGRRASKDVEAPVEMEFVSSRSPASSSTSSARRQPPPPPVEEPSQELSLDDAPCWVDPREDLVGFLYHHKLYNCVDPFEKLTETWLETGDKYAEGEDLGDEEEEAKKKQAQEKELDPAAVAKAEAIRRQLQVSTGHLIFMRGRDLRCELVDQVERRRLQRTDSTHLSSTASTVSSVKPTGSLTSDAGLFWYVAPKYPKGAKKAGIAAPTRRKNWCWRSDFIQEALNAAIGMGMEHPVVDAAAAMLAVKRNPEAAIAIRHHVAVSSTDKRAELWSPSFLQSLDVLRKLWDFGGEVRLEETELITSSPEAMKAFARFKRDSSPSADFKLPEPKGFLHAGYQPPPPELPDRLPARQAYNFVPRPERRGSTASQRPLRVSGSLSQHSLGSGAPDGLQRAGSASLGLGARFRPSGGHPKFDRSMSQSSARSSKRVSFLEH